MLVKVPPGALEGSPAVLIGELELANVAPAWTASDVNMNTTEHRILFV